MSVVHEYKCEKITNLAYSEFAAGLHDVICNGTVETPGIIHKMKVAIRTEGLAIVADLNKSTSPRFWEFTRDLVHVNEIP
jgi:hypothetical protein